MQVLYPTVGRREPILGTVGPLQLEVLAARLASVPSDRRLPVV